MSVVVVVVREVPSSYAQAITEFATLGTINVNEAQRQHAAYIQAIKDNPAVDKVYVIEADERYPDCMFIEDTCVIARGQCIVTCPGAESRRGEVDAVLRFFSDGGDGHAWVDSVHDMRALDGEATCDGGDVMLVDNAYLFVGLSSRTNAKGVEVLKTVFAPVGIDVVGIPLMAEDGLHLKSVVTWGGEEVGFIVSDDAMGRAAFEAITTHLLPLNRDLASKVTYTHSSCCNVLRIGSTLYHSEGVLDMAKKHNEGSNNVNNNKDNNNNNNNNNDNSTTVCDLCDSVGVSPCRVNNYEAQKADGALTCCSLVIHK